MVAARLARNGTGVTVIRVENTWMQRTDASGETAGNRYEVAARVTRLVAHQTPITAWSTATGHNATPCSP
jgi:hypothetical protein